jgi:hypothetical protein
MRRKDKTMTKAKVEDTKTDPLAVGRHCGDSIWGYEVFEDGRIKLSPGFADRFRTVLDRETGLLSMQEGVNRMVAAELARTSKERREWWDALQGDLGIEIGKGSGWAFDIHTGSVTPPKPDPDAT